MSAYHNLTKNEQLQFLIWMEAECYEHKYFRGHELEGVYEQFLNDVYGTVEVAGYTYDVAETLKAVDPTAYDCGLADYISDEFVEITPDLYLETNDCKELVAEFLEDCASVELLKGE